MFIGNKKCRIYAACGVSQTPNYTLRIVRKEKNRGIVKEILAGSVLCSHVIRYAKYIRRKSSFRKMGY